MKGKKKTKVFREVFSRLTFTQFKAILEEVKNWAFLEGKTEKIREIRSVLEL